MIKMAPLDRCWTAGVFGYLQYIEILACMFYINASLDT